jgi:hypothetical protein
MSAPMMPAGGELVDFEAEGEEHWVKLKLKDGSVLKFKSVVSAIFRMGNDPNTGLPIYAIQTANIVRLASVPKELVVKKQVGGYG